MKPVSQLRAVNWSLARPRVLFWLLPLAFVAGLLTWQLQGSQAAAAGGLVSGEAGSFVLGEGCDEPSWSLDLDVDDPSPLTLALILAFRDVPRLGETCSHCRDLHCNPHPARAPPAPIA